MNKKIYQLENWINLYHKLINKQYEDITQEEFTVLTDLCEKNILTKLQ